MGFLVDETTPMIWRGPMVISAIKTLTQKVLWKDLDFIIIDMPPGTGDTQLTFAQEVKVDGAIIVSTPQDLALMDVQRGIKMFDKTKVKILGLVDNMSFFKNEDGKKYNIFGEGGVEKTAKEFKKKFLGKVPISIKLRESADLGLPLTYGDPNNDVSKIFNEIANKVEAKVIWLGPFLEYRYNPKKIVSQVRKDGSVEQKYLKVHPNSPILFNTLEEALNTIEGKVFISRLELSKFLIVQNFLY